MCGFFSFGHGLIVDPVSGMIPLGLTSLKSCQNFVSVNVTSSGAK